MLNLFSKSKKPAKGKKSAGDKDVKKKRPAKKAAKPAEKEDLSPDQSMVKAAERLDQAREKLDVATDNGKKSGQVSRQELIAEAMAVHKVQSRLLDDLDEETRTKLRALAIKKMFLSKRPGGDN
jgi:hypothetical protein